MISQMSKEIFENQEELNKQREEYQNLFELVPCYITVQDRDLKLIKYNQEFGLPNLQLIVGQSEFQYQYLRGFQTENQCL